MLTGLIYKRNEKRGFTRIAKFLEPVIDPLKRLEGTLDVIVQVNAGIASPIWGPLRMAITIACQHLSALERLAFIVDKIAQSVQRYQDLAALFASHAGVREAVGRLYSEIDRAAQAAHFQEAKEVREKLAQEMRVEDDLQRHLSQYSDGSCDWVLQADQFQKWLSSPGNETLEIVGHPGSGKSTLAAFLVKHLSQYERVLYFFCDRKIPERVCILRTLLAQVLQHEPNMADQMLDDDPSKGAKCYFIIIDGDYADYWRHSFTLNDDSARRAQGRVSRGQGSNERTHLKFLFTRCAETGATSHVLSLDSSYIQDHIRSYVHRRIQEIPSIAGTSLGEQVTNTISKQADGLWLYARLMMDDIERAPSRKAITECLSSLPQGLSEVYDRIIQENNGRLSDYERRFAQWFYLWLDISDIFPGFLLQEEDHLPIQIMDIVFQYVNGGEPVFDTPGLAKRLGDRLVDLRQTTTGYEVAAVHQSFYPYLSRALLRPLWSKKLSRGIAAVWYFTECPESKQHLDDLRSASSAPINFYRFESHFPFHYALLQAFACSRFCSDESSSNAERRSEEGMMAQLLIEFISPGKCLRWFEISTIINYSENFSELLHNVLYVLEALEDDHFRHQNFEYHRNSAALAALNEQRVPFFKSWKYVLLKTTPWDPNSKKKPNVIEPPGFSEDPICQKMMEIATRCSEETDIFARQLAEISRALSSKADPATTAVQEQQAPFDAFSPFEVSMPFANVADGFPHLDVLPILSNGLTNVWQFLDFSPSLFDGHTQEVSPATPEFLGTSQFADSYSK
ncbi:hypothetical protein CNMCM5793_000003 [Aspergillus hiratsukae]|uniref:Nephrocystin 3-like N-terminal domain-containing protein n=1 Tax=Aspergillus hiratsukae TaxID=1194566 RepID=A0A8H6PTM4_9EURO|nr:hypothetical protein CNMCM5793_000003 [Aspergillus hiratsukae]KAF7160845.1 hypothetical protein CNMCM6106_008206 [Aspergillus hiratsukae]